MLTIDHIFNMTSQSLMQLLFQKIEALEGGFLDDREFRLEKCLHSRTRLG